MKKQLIVVPTLCLGLLVPAPAGATVHRPLDDGGDTAPCVTSHEFNVVPVGANRRQVRRIFDTPGHRVGKGEMRRHAAAFIALLGGIKVETAPRSHRIVKRYPSCAEDGVPALVLVEFDTRKHRWTQMIWE